MQIRRRNRRDPKFQEVLYSLEFILESSTQIQQRNRADPRFEEIFYSVKLIFESHLRKFGEEIKEIQNFMKNSLFKIYKTYSPPRSHSNSAKKSKDPKFQEALHSKYIEYIYSLPRSHSNSAKKSRDPKFQEALFKIYKTYSPPRSHSNSAKKRRDPKFQEAFYSVKLIFESHPRKFGEEIEEI